MNASAPLPSETGRAPAPVASSRNYPLLLIGQFLGAFGDNFLLKAILGPLTYELQAHRITESQVTLENTLFTIVNAVPFMLMAPIAGFLNDRMPKTTWLAGGNLVKVIGAAIGLAGVTLFSGSNHLLQLIGYTVVGAGACLYSPAKYGILPEIVSKDRLVKANGTVEMLTLVAIVSGLGLGALMYDHTRSLAVCYVAALAMYAVALVCNGAMQKTPHNPAAKVTQSVHAFFRSAYDLFSTPRLAKILIGSSLFWFAGSCIKNAIQSWGVVVYTEAGSEVSNVKISFLLLAMTIGIVSGSVLVGQLHKTGDLSWSRRYASVMGIAIVALGMIGGHFGVWAAMAGLVVMGMASGMLLIPLNAALQSESNPATLGKTISIQNFTDYAGIFGGAGFVMLLTRFSLTSGTTLEVIGATICLITLCMGAVTKRRTQG